MNCLKVIGVFICISFFIAACGSGGGGGNGGVVGDVSTNTPTAAYTISGTISAASNSAADSDVNDKNAPYSSNDSIATAQSVPNPILIGGYVNEAFTGEEGRSFTSGDVDDYFKVYLTDKQTITLVMGDEVSTDRNLDLYLYDTAGNNVDSSTGNTKTETLTVTTAGTYFVQVTALKGYSTYVLSIGQQIASASEKENALFGDEFVPGEIIVRFKDNVVSASNIDSLTARARSAGLFAKSGGPGRAMLMSLGDDQQRRHTFQTLGIPERTDTEAQIFAGASQESQLKSDTLRVINAMRKRPDVLYAEPNYIRHAYAAPDDTHYTLQWHYPLINLPQAWDVTTGDSSVIVAVIDTGILLGHPDLQGQLDPVSVPGYDFVSDINSALDGDGIDDNPDDPGDQRNPDGSSSFHGTHVAGTVGARTNNSNGVAGVAWDVIIMPVRVLGKGASGTNYDILQGVRYAAGLQNDSFTFPAQRADIINLSLGGDFPSQPAQDVYTQARAAGVIVIAAAGNSSTTQPHYPAAYDGVISVSAVDINKTLTHYSSYGSTIDVAAPGGDTGSDKNGDGNPDGVLSTLGDDSGGNIDFNYVFYQGTSMASPHVAGVAALMKSVHAGLTPIEFDTWLESGDLTEDIGSQGRDDQFGHGLIDAYTAVSKAQSAPPSTTPNLVVVPSSLNFEISFTSLSIAVVNGGGGSLTVDPPVDDAAWLIVTETNVDFDTKTGTYTATVNRNGLSDGPYSATITFTSSANTVTVSVTMIVSSSSAADAGYHHVLLLDAVSSDTIQEFPVAVNKGVYHYTFTGIGKGEYTIVAGSDFDNDNDICDSGEACGVYKTLDQPITLKVDKDMRDIDFVTGYSFDLGANSFENHRGYKRSISEKSRR